MLEFRPEVIDNRRRRIACRAIVKLKPASPVALNSHGHDLAAAEMIELNEALGVGYALRVRFNTDIPSIRFAGLHGEQGLAKVHPDVEKRALLRRKQPRQEIEHPGLADLAHIITELGRQKFGAHLLSLPRLSKS